ncbi:hypothetical protein HF086_009881 [Spodoptera exigua]|uniref:Uncharacterized protein n=1 Tax=Spodoptera exigua TaxID=7107 RepID=A0A922M4M5_SPOEX|nr:hypothetical protein HF086_009881 [Spodoptera exigua]
MILKLLILVIFVSYVASDLCVKYDFEENYDDILGNYGPCSSDMMSEWILDEYNNLGLNSPHERSTKFITPTRGVLSCWSSFLFTMSPRGTLQVKLYMNSDFNSDFLQILAVQDNEESEALPFKQKSPQKCVTADLIKVFNTKTSPDMSKIIRGLIEEGILEAPSPKLRLETRRNKLGVGDP